MLISAIAALSLIGIAIANPVRQQLMKPRIIPILESGRMENVSILLNGNVLIWKSIYRFHGDIVNKKGAHCSSPFYKLKILTMIKHYLIILITCTYSIVFPKVIELDNTIPTDELGYIYRYGVSRTIIIKNNNLYIAGRNSIYQLDENNRLDKISVIPNSNVGALSIAVDSSLIAAHFFNQNDGILYILVINQSGDKIAGPIPHHKKTGKMFFNRKDSTIIMRMFHF